MKILVVDDDDVSALVLSDRLQDLGYDVTVASDGAEAWSRIQETSFRIVILDWMMPQMDGMEVCRRIRGMESESYTYVILLTGRTDRKDRLEALEGGADDFLTKPLDQAELLARLKAADRILRSEEAVRLTNQELQRARQKELQIGAHIQQKLLYTPPPVSVPAFHAATVSIPSQAVDGDFCDFFVHGDEVVDVFVGDVMGKGVPAAMVGAGVKTSLQRCLISLLTESRGESLPEPARLIQALDAEVCPELIDLNTFLTLCFARFDTGKGKLTFVNCGHPKLVHWIARENRCELLDATAVPLGFSDHETYVQSEVDLEPGDLIVLYSDGVTDLRTPDGTRLGMSGFGEWVRERASGSLDVLAQDLRTLRDASPGMLAVKDDFTCVAVRYVSRRNAEGDLDLWADGNSLRRVREFVRDRILESELPFTDAERNEILLALQEATSNAVRHANPGHESLRLNVSAGAVDEVFRIELRYPGVPFDATGLPEPSYDGSRDGGFGVAIMRRCLDRVTYSVDGGRNLVVLEKSAAKGVN